MYYHISSTYTNGEHYYGVMEVIEGVIISISPPFNNYIGRSFQDFLQQASYGYTIKRVDWEK